MTPGRQIELPAILAEIRYRASLELGPVHALTRLGVILPEHFGSWLSPLRGAEIAPTLRLIRLGWEYAGIEAKDPERSIRIAAVLAARRAARAQSFRFPFNDHPPEEELVNPRWSEAFGVASLMAGRDLAFLAEGGWKHDGLTIASVYVHYHPPEEIDDGWRFDRAGVVCQSYRSELNTLLVVAVAATRQARGDQRLARRLVGWPFTRRLRGRYCWIPFLWGRWLRDAATAIGIAGPVTGPTPAIVAACSPPADVPYETRVRVGIVPELARRFPTLADQVAWEEGSTLVVSDAFHEQLRGDPDLRAVVQELFRLSGIIFFDVRARDEGGMSLAEDDSAPARDGA